MTKEQKKAIKVLEQYKNECIEEYKVELDDKKNIDEQHASYLHQQIEAVYIILNLIQEQEKEINKYLEIIANKVIETAKDDLLTEKNIEIEKKDKIIDELAKAFKQDDVRSVEEIKQFYERKVKDESND